MAATSSPQAGRSPGLPTHALNHAGIEEVLRAYAGGHRMRDVYARATVAEMRLREGLRELARQAASWRVVAYRDYVGSTVRSASPLLLRLCSAEGVDLDELAWRMEPDLPWTSWLCGPTLARPGVHMRKAGGGLSRPTPSDVASCELTHFAHSGLVVRRRPAPGAWGLRVLGDRLETAFFMGDARVRTFGEGGAISLPGELPATLIAALPGRALEDLVSHPLLDGAGCVVASVDEPNRWGTKVRLSCPAVAWRMPWARDGRGASGATGSERDEVTARPRRPKGISS